MKQLQTVFARIPIGRISDRFREVAVSAPQVLDFVFPWLLPSSFWPCWIDWEVCQAKCKLPVSLYCFRVLRNSPFARSYCFVDFRALNSRFMYFSHFLIHNDIISSMIHFGRFERTCFPPPNIIHKMLRVPEFLLALRFCESLYMTSATFAERFPSAH